MKPNTAKAKGRDRENRAVAWLQSHGYHAERRRLTGSADRGDISGIPGVTIEVKSAAQWTPVQWQRELRAEMANDRTDIGFVMAAPKGVLDVADWIFAVPSEVLLRLLDDAGWGPG